VIFITETECVYCAVRTEFTCNVRILTLQSPVVIIRTASLTFNNSTFCPHSVFMFCVDLRTNSDCFAIRTASSAWFL